VIRILPVQHARKLVQLRVDRRRYGGNSELTGQRIEPVSLVGADRNEMVSVGMLALRHA